MKIFIILLISLVPCVAFSSDYDDCILKNMAGSNSNVAAYQVQVTCKNMTTPDACKGKNLENRKVISINKKININKDEINKLKNEAEELALLGGDFMKKCIGTEKSFMECYSNRYYDEESDKKYKIRYLSSVSDEEVLSSCLDYCGNQNYFSKKFGECKTDW